MGKARLKLGARKATWDKRNYLRLKPTALAWAIREHCASVGERPPGTRVKVHAGLIDDFPVEELADAIVAQNPWTGLGHEPIIFPFERKNAHRIPTEAFVEDLLLAFFIADSEGYLANEKRLLSNSLCASLKRAFNPPRRKCRVSWCKRLLYAAGQCRKHWRNGES